MEKIYELTVWVGMVLAISTVARFAWCLWTGFPVVGR